MPAAPVTSGALAVLELNDAGIVTALASRGVSAPSPGYALLDGRKLIVGREAAARARLQPRRVHTRFWELLDTSPLRRPFPSRLSAADLVHAHLGEIWAEASQRADEVLLAVPGWWNEEQLALLLGVARSAGMPVSGLVDAGVAASAPHGSAERSLHLDIGLHRTVLTVTHHADGAHRLGVYCNERVGLLELMDAWAKLIASLFVRSTRFDPLHLAATEQALYDAMPGWLAAVIARGTQNLSLESGDRRHSISLSSGQAESAVEAEFRQLAALVRVHAEPPPEALLLGFYAASVPGLQERLAADTGLDVMALPPGAAATAALHRAEQIRRPGEDALPFITHLQPRAAAVAAPTEEPELRSSATPRPAPSHVLLDGIAHPVAEDLVVGSAPLPGDHDVLRVHDPDVAATHCRLRRIGQGVVVESLSSQDTSVNGSVVGGATEVVAGDILRLGASTVELQLITVAEPHGPP